MKFSIYLPEQQRPPSVLYCLANLTANHETFPTRSNFAQHASHHNLAMVFPDTSPRNLSYALAAETDAAYVSHSAGFYWDATNTPWSSQFNMYTYVSAELPYLIESYFNVSERKAVTGYSMGGNAAIVIGCREQKFESVSAFAPICDATNPKSNYS